MSVCHTQLCWIRCPFREEPAFELCEKQEFLNISNCMYNIKTIFSRMSVGSKTLPLKSGIWLVYSFVLSCILTFLKWFPQSLFVLLLSTFSGYCTLAIIWWGWTVWPVRAGRCTRPRFVCWTLLQELWGPWTSHSTWPSGWHIKKISTLSLTKIQDMTLNTQVPPLPVVARSCCLKAILTRLHALRSHSWIAQK